MRFAHDKTPYKTHQGGYVAAAPATGWYVEVSARGVRTGGGFYDATGPALAKVRDAMADDRTGAQLERILAAFEADDWERSGDLLKTAPRGFDRDHPRIGLLRHRSLTMGRHHGFDPVIHTADLVEVVRRDWRELRPLVEWLAPRTAE